MTRATVTPQTSIKDDLETITVPFVKPDLASKLKKEESDIPEGHKSLIDLEVHKA